MYIKLYSMKRVKFPAGANITRKPVFGFPTIQDSNQTSQLQRIARILKLCMEQLSR